MYNIVVITPIKFADGYKQNHKPEYPENTQLVYDNFTPRSSRTDNKFVINFGLQYFIKEYLIERFNRDFFNQPKELVINDFYSEISTYLNDPDFDVSHMAALHDLGYLPLRIKALPEGAKVPLQVPLFTLVNTKPEFFWLPNYLETILSCICWMPITSATTAFHLRQILKKYAYETVGNLDFIQWQAHDFSFRGMAGLEAALMSGGAHLTSFTGTDTIPAIPWLRNYYQGQGFIGKKMPEIKISEVIGGSVAATEHSVMCAGGEDDEISTFKRLLLKVHPKGILSIVSDTWDYFNVLTNILPQIKDIIMKREGKLVIRPDSGDQFHIICGYNMVDLNEYIGNLVLAKEKFPNTDGYSYNGKYYLYPKEERGKPIEISEAEVKGTIQLLWELFGGTHTDTGYKLLDSHIGCILGDGVTPKLMERILARLEENKFASYNMVFGIGSYTYQCVTRDTYGMAMKATFCKIDGIEKEIFKNPKTSTGAFIKKSAKGLLQVKKNCQGEFYLKDQATWAEEQNSELKTVFENGKLVKETSLKEIRDRIQSYG